MKTKLCPACKVLKNRSEFYKNCARFDGLKVYCKRCDRLRSKLDYIKLKSSRPWRIIYNALCNRCNNPSHIKFSYYGGRGIKALITLDEVRQLWFRDSAYLMIKPSIDRVNSNGNYIYDNCRFIEQSENAKRAA